MKQNKSLWIFLALLALTLVILLSSCKTEKEPSSLGPHPAGWNDPTSSAFHGPAAQRDSNQCRECHGQDLHGGSSGSSCYTCHANFPHSASWMDTTSAGFHGLAAKADSSKACATCHGADFRGGLSGSSCYTCHSAYPHSDIAGWTQPVSSDTTFHGWMAMRDSSGAAASCMPCHGANLHGTARANSCYDCHTLLHTSVVNEDIDTHRAFVASKHWKLAGCQACHDSTFSGGRAATVDPDAACTNCHAPTDDAMVLTGCNVCHTTDPTVRPNWKVPFGMDPGAAGAHSLHVAVNKFSCRECHPSLSASGHPHALPAEVSFSRAVLADTFGFQPTFAYVGTVNSGNGACSNVYCHSTGVQPHPGQPTAFPQWTLHGGCGMCHAIPPSVQQDPAHLHTPGLNCNGCHHDVDPTSNFAIPDSIRFLNDSLHVDGVIEG